MTTGAIILADVAERTDVLRIACTQCERADSYPVQTLIWRYGRYAKVPNLLRRLSANCPRRRSDLCGIHCPEMAEIFLPRLAEIE